MCDRYVRQTRKLKLRGRWLSVQSGLKLIARAILLTLVDGTSRDIALAFGVREDTVRLWRGGFMATGPHSMIGALKSKMSPGPLPVKAEAALRVAAPLLSQDVANRQNWTLARLSREIQAREGIST